MAPPPEHHERHIVGAAVHGALLRLCGGGIVLPPAPADRGGGGVLHLPPDWHRTLRELARKSVSFPNGKRRRRPRPGGFPGEVEGGGGKPHDIEVRAALSLYNRFAGRGGRPDRRRQAAEAKAETAESGSAQSRLQMVSNMGLHRPIRSATGLASLLAQDMERNGAAPGSSGTVAADAADDGRAEAAAVPPLSVLCNDVRSDASGIICLITKSRMDALRQSGRLPCPLCTKWCREGRGCGGTGRWSTGPNTGWRRGRPPTPQIAWPSFPTNRTCYRGRRSVRGLRRQRASIATLAQPAIPSSTPGGASWKI